MRVSPTSTKAEWVLRAMLALQCVGMARSIFVKGTPIASFLFLDLKVAESIVVAVDRGAAAALLLLALAIVVAPHRAMLYALAVWFVTVAVLTMYMGRGSFGSHGALLEQSIRYLAPLALVALMNDRAKVAERLLVWGAAFVFFAHGVEALLQNPKFIDYLIRSVDRVTDYRMTQATAEFLLYGIGALDVLLAVLVFTKQRKPALVYMAFWGFATAGMRMIYYGPEAGFHHTLIRALNGGAPLMLLLMGSRWAALKLATAKGMRWSVGEG